VALKRRYMKLGIVIPCYNEEAVLAETTQRVEALFNEMIKNREISDDSFVCFVDHISPFYSHQLLNQTR